MFFPLELGDLWSSRSWVGLEMILMFSSLLQFCFGEQYSSIYFLSFLLFPAVRQLPIMQCHNKRVSAKNVSSIQTEVPAQTEGEKDLFLPAGTGG